MLTADFDFELPADLIAQEAAPRGESRLFVPGAPVGRRHRRAADLPELLSAGDLLVLNDTRVIPARLFARAPGGGRVEILLVTRSAPTEWEALARPGRKARSGVRLTLDEGLEAEVLELFEDGRRRIRFSQPIEPYLNRLGHVPLPPYIKRADRADDAERYQTVWARVEGAIAAPTAGLHFTESILDAVRARGVEIATLTLHVGIGTFKPVVSTLAHEHSMDPERIDIPQATATAVTRRRQAGGRVVALGTTVVRALEGAATGGRLTAGSGTTDLFIRPGHTFHIVDALITNFHLPRSTLLMLVCAFAGRQRTLAAYRDAVREGYRFYSYGDAMYVERFEGT